MGTLNKAVNAVKKALGIKEKVNLKEINNELKGAGKISAGYKRGSKKYNLRGSGAYKQAYRSNKRYL